MKKIFAIMAAAVMVFGLASCSKKDGNGASGKEFKIQLSNIGTTTFDLKVTPGVEGKTYAMGFIAAKLMKDKYHFDIDKVMEDYAPDAYTEEVEWNCIYLLSDVDYVAFAYYYDETTGEHSKKMTYVTFRTKKVTDSDIKSTFDLQIELPEIYDNTKEPFTWEKEDGTIGKWYGWEIDAYVDAQTTMYLYPYSSKSLTGHYTTGDFVDYGAYFDTYYNNKHNLTEMCCVDITISGKAPTYHVKGYLVDFDMYRYNIDFDAVLPVDGVDAAPALKAPAKKSAHKAPMMIKK